MWPKDGTLRDSIISAESGPGSNSNEGVFHTPQISSTGTSLTDAVWNFTQDTIYIYIYIRGGGSIIQK